MPTDAQVEAFGRKLHGTFWETAAPSLRKQYRAALEAAEAAAWRPIAEAPKDKLILVWAPGREGLPSMFSLCLWHPDAGFCIDELRQPEYWHLLPESPRSE